MRYLYCLRELVRGLNISHWPQPTGVREDWGPVLGALGAVLAGLGPRKPLAVTEDQRQGDRGGEQLRRVPETLRIPVASQL